MKKIKTLHKVTDPLKIEWDKKKGNVTRKCPVCQKSFKAEHWKQTICNNSGGLCKEYKRRKYYYEANKKRFDEIVLKVKKAGYKPII